MLHCPRPAPCPCRTATAETRGGSRVSGEVAIACGAPAVLEWYSNTRMTPRNDSSRTKRTRSSGFRHPTQIPPCASVPALGLASPFAYLARDTWGFVPDSRTERLHDPRARRRRRL